MELLVLFLLDDYAMLMRTNKTETVYRRRWETWWASKHPEKDYWGLWRLLGESLHYIFKRLFVSANNFLQNLRAVRIQGPKMAAQQKLISDFIFLLSNMFSMLIFWGDDINRGHKVIVMEAFFFRDRHGKDIMHILCLCNPVVLSVVDFSRRLLRLLHIFKEIFIKRFTIRRWLFW